jgi:UDP-4-amino-4-deoxy-L-arabinose-oxoglutarate aminotransferase
MVGKPDPRKEFLPFSRPVISEQEIAAVAEVLRSGWITTGPKTAELERRFREYVGVAGAVALTSASAGMHLALKALGIGTGDEVVTPSMTWVSTVNLITLAGATPVFADVDRDTLVMTASTVERCLSDRTKLIVPVHFAGAAVDMDPIRTLARGSGIAVIEDAAHALGTRYRGEPVGSRGTSIFSFHPIKNITTGEGGMVCSDDARFLDGIRRLKFHGLDVDAWERTTQGRPPRAEVVEPGFKYNLTDVAAALGLGQLERIDAFNDRRSALAGIYRERLADVDEILPLDIPDGTTRHAWALFVVRLDLERARIDRDGLIARLKQRNIGAGLHFRAVHLHAYYRRNPHLWRGEVPNTEWNSERILSLPLFPAMEDDDVHRVVDAIEEVLA